MHLMEMQLPPQESPITFFAFSFFCLLSRRSWPQNWLLSHPYAAQLHLGFFSLITEIDLGIRLRKQKNDKNQIMHAKSIAKR